MKAIFFQSNKERQLFIVVFGLVCLACLTFFFWSFSNKAEPLSPGVVIPPGQEYLPEINFPALEEEIIEQRVLFPEITLPLIFGREDPFASF